jgi:exodeoxyribonuclease VII large subunit
VARRPFDPRLARGGLFDGARGASVPDGSAPAPSGAPAAPEAARDGGGADAPISVSEASARIRRAVESTGRQRIVGEVSNFSQRQHWYFTLKDSEAQLDCVMWASSTASARVVPANGMEVVVEGAPTHWGPRGRTQLVVRSLSRRGAGSLQQRFEELCRVLREEGYFDESRKRRLPTFPRAVAVITSLQGAALQDVLRTARLRAPFVRILAVDVPVQGDAAAPAIAAAIDAVDRRADELGIDAMIVTRGGGSIEDLWAFNERAVADALLRARTPVVAAIGHESDTTVAELVADRRASTPTAAVMLLLPDREGMQQQVDHLHDRLNFLVRRGVADGRRAVEQLARHPFLRSPRGAVDMRRASAARLAARLASAARARLSRERASVGELRARFEAHRPAARQAAARATLDALAARLARGARAALDSARSRAAGADRQLRILGPGETLARGWTLTFTEDGRLVRTAADVRPGDLVRTRTSGGSLDSRVERADSGGPVPG